MHVLFLPFLFLFFFSFGACTFVLMVPNTATLTYWKAPSWTVDSAAPEHIYIYLYKNINSPPWRL